MNILTKCKLIVKEEKNHGTVPLRAKTNFYICALSERTEDYNLDSSIVVLLSYFKDSNCESKAKTKLS